jgi:CheY-like chemotaxis protein
MSGGFGMRFNQEETQMKGESERDRGTNGGGGARSAGILIADDMALNLTSLKFELESRGFIAWLAVDGDDAIDLYGRHRGEIDLVLLSVQMPGLDGPHTLEELRRLNPQLVACFMCGTDGQYSREELFARGAVCVFTKPISPVEIANVLQRIEFTYANHSSPLETT